MYPVSSNGERRLLISQPPSSIRSEPAPTIQDRLTRQSGGNEGRRGPRNVGRPTPRDAFTRKTGKTPPGKTDATAPTPGTDDAAGQGATIPEDGLRPETAATDGYNLR